eukprot:2938055-Rhodomonas_salina.1
MLCPLSSYAWATPRPHRKCGTEIGYAAPGGASLGESRAVHGASGPAKSNAKRRILTYYHTCACTDGVRRKVVAAYRSWCLCHYWRVSEINCKHSRSWYKVYCAAGVWHLISHAHYTNVRGLRFSYSSLGDNGLAAFLGSLAPGHGASVTFVALHEARVSGAGMAALAAAVQK